MEMHAPPPAHIQTHTAAGYTLAKNTHRHTKILSFFHQKHTHTHTHTHTHPRGRPSLHKKTSLTPRKSDSAICQRREKKKLQLCRKPFCKSLLGSPKHMRSHTHTHTHTPMNGCSVHARSHAYTSTKNAMEKTGSHFLISQWAGLSAQIKGPSAPELQRLTD